MVYRMKREIKNILIHTILYIKNFKIENSVIIFSEARGGSTWLMEILSKIPRSCINWEPLHEEKGVVPQNFNWGPRPYIPYDDQNKLYFDLIKNILQFKVYSNWSSKYFAVLKIKEMIRCKFLIIKFVRANLLLPYIMNKFNFNNKPILLIRHPIDVCISQIKAFDGDDKNYSVKIPNSINNDRFYEHKDFIESLQTKLEYKIAHWCLNNSLLLQDSETLKKVTIVFYSDLLLKPKEETLRILKTLNFIRKADIDRIIDSINFRIPSKTNFKNNFNSDPQKQLYKNFEDLSKLEKDSIQGIFNHFQINLFDAYQPLPNKNNI